MSHDWNILWPNSRLYSDNVILYWPVDKHRPGLSIKQNRCASLYPGDEHKKRTSQILIYVLIVESDFVLYCRYFPNQVALKGGGEMCMYLSGLKTQWALEKVPDLVSQVNPRDPVPVQGKSSSFSIIIKHFSPFFAHRGWGVCILKSGRTLLGGDLSVHFC